MSPIISPWWFYFIDVLGEIKSIFTFEKLGALLFIGIVILILFYVAMLFMVDCTDFDENKAESLFIKSIKLSKKIGIIFAVCTLITTFIPKEETMYKMMVANFVTYENVEYATEAIEDGVDYIMDKLDKDKEEDK